MCKMFCRRHKKLTIDVGDMCVEKCDDCREKEIITDKEVEKLWLK